MPYSKKTDTKEHWRPIEDFPGYSISDWGFVWSHKSDMRLSTSRNTNGIVKVNLVRDGEIITRSVKTMVAEAFLDRQLDLPLSEDEESTPINIDGNQQNNRVDNLAWRPRWFAWKYTHQFNYKPPREYLTQVVNERTQNVYTSVMEAGIAEGLLWEYVYQSMITGRPVYPTGSVFNFLFNSH